MSLLLQKKKFVIIPYVSYFNYYYFIRLEYDLPQKIVKYVAEKHTHTTIENINEDEPFFPILMASIEKQEKVFIYLYYIIFGEKQQLQTTLKNKRKNWFRTGILQRNTSYGHFNNKEC